MAVYTVLPLPPNRTLSLGQQLLWGFVPYYDPFLLKPTFDRISAQRVRRSLPFDDIHSIHPLLNRRNPGRMQGAARGSCTAVTDVGDPR